MAARGGRRGVSGLARGNLTPISVVQSCRVIGGASSALWTQGLGAVRILHSSCHTHTHTALHSLSSSVIESELSGLLKGGVVWQCSPAVGRRSRIRYVFLDPPPCSMADDARVVLATLTSEATNAPIWVTCVCTQVWRRVRAAGSWKTI